MAIHLMQEHNKNISEIRTLVARILELFWIMKTKNNPEYRIVLVTKEMQCLNIDIAPLLETHLFNEDHLYQKTIWL